MKKQKKNKKLKNSGKMKTRTISKLLERQKQVSELGSGGY